MHCCVRCRGWIYVDITLKAHCCPEATNQYLKGREGVEWEVRGITFAMDLLSATPKHQKSGVMHLKNECSGRLKY